jgi:hypothetical protein
VAGADVEEHEFIRSVSLVAPGNLNRVAGVAQLQEIDAFDHPATIYVQTGNDAFGQHE